MQSADHSNIILVASIKLKNLVKYIVHTSAIGIATV